MKLVVLAAGILLVISAASYAHALVRLNTVSHDAQSCLEQAGMDARSVAFCEARFIHETVDAASNAGSGHFVRVLPQVSQALDLLDRQIDHLKP